MWAYDFVFDTCANRQTLKCLTIVDEWTRECLAIDVAGGIRSRRAIEVLAQLVSVHGAPRHLRSACYELVAVGDPPALPGRPAAFDVSWSQARKREPLKHHEKESS